MFSLNLELFKLYTFWKKQSLNKKKVEEYEKIIEELFNENKKIGEELEKYKSNSIDYKTMGDIEKLFKDILKIHPKSFTKEEEKMFNLIFNKNTFNTLQSIGFSYKDIGKKLTDIFNESILSVEEKK